MDTSAHPAPPRIVPGSLTAWLVALRPKTLWIAGIPVFVGTALAFALAQDFRLDLAALALAGSIMMQVVTNLQNDVGYTILGKATDTHVGASRATANGWLPVRSVQRAVGAAVLVTMLIGAPLIVHGGWPVLAMGVASLLAAYAYMGGPRPIAFTPFGELTVFVFFGVVAVAGSFFVQAGNPPPAVWLAAAAVGAHAAAVLAVNNHRDAAHDRLTGRRTFAVAFGQVASARLYRLLVYAPFALAPLAALAAHSPWLALPLLALPAAVALVRDFSGQGSGPAFNAILFRTVKLELAFGAWLTLGAAITGLR